MSSGEAGVPGPDADAPVDADTAARIVTGVTLLTMPLLERQPALDLLGAALADATGGAGRVALVAGEAGIGKTSLVRAFTADVPVRVLRGACDDLLTPGPLGPVRDVARTLGGPLAAALGGGPGEIADALLDALATPSVLVVEDVHWADEATLDLLAFLGRRVEQCPSLVVLTYRDDELGPTTALRRVLGVLRPPVAVRIALPPLSL
ncbi:hypothetical protein GCM10010472_05960 [Pseudonocardia halophobica]|uniref:AAA+ ATPase domain-containing protein n=2 Tax=Pseudonocardia halophobica TaxID=29401 RepID=A0A9W6KZQ5_9PSEU|nr:hypothetical protein GCM10017577_14070 [Pseudonocardia halophobica]